MNTDNKSINKNKVEKTKRQTKKEKINNSNDNKNINEHNASFQLNFPIGQCLSSGIMKKNKKGKNNNGDFKNIFLITFNKSTFYQGIEAIARAGNKFDFSIRNKLSFLQSKRPREKKTLKKINIDLFNNNFKPQPSLTQLNNYSLLSSLFDSNIPKSKQQ